MTNERVHFILHLIELLYRLGHHCLLALRVGCWPLEVIHSLKVGAVKSVFAFGFLEAAREVWTTNWGLRSTANILHDRLLVFRTKFVMNRLEPR